MNIVYMGTPTFALPTLSALAEHHEVRAVFTRPDAASHRGKKPLPSLVKARALELGIPVYTPESFYVSLEDGSPLLDCREARVVDAQILANIEACEPDFIVVAAYGMVLPEEILTLPRVACVNIHASLLPRWRGAAPIQRALLAGDELIGVSIMHMQSGLDTGPYCLQASTSAENKYYQELIIEMGQMGADLLVPNLEAIAAGEVTWTEQNEVLVTYADKVEKGSINLDSSLTVQENYNRVRASSHHARCRSTFFDRSAMILRAEPATEVNRNCLYYECSDGLLEILSLKPDGKREMTGAAFLAGLR